MQIFHTPREIWRKFCLFNENFKKIWFKFEIKWFVILSECEVSLKVCQKTAKAHKKGLKS